MKRNMQARPTLKTATDRALYRNMLEAERAQREQDLAEKREAGLLKSPSANRKRKKHGRR